MEVLQTSALPLGDGAGRNRIVRGGIPAASTGGDNSVSVGGSQEHNLNRATNGEATAAASRHDARGAESGAGAHVAKRARRGYRVPDDSKLERETGFEPATSTLARSHSTTELFPPTRPARRRHYSRLSRCLEASIVPQRSRRQARQLPGHATACVSSDGGPHDTSNADR